VDRAHFSGMNRKKAQQNTFPYTVVEAALCDVFGIGEDGLTNFRSKLRHLKNIGVPRDLPRPGSGKKIQLTIDQAFQLAFAICLELYGMTPKLAANVGPDLVASVRWMSAGPHGDFYAVFTRRSVEPEPMVELGMGYGILSSLEHLQAKLKDELVDWGTDALLVLNVSNLMRKVKKELKDVS
jgi:hypothetical protein